MKKLAVYDSEIEIASKLYADVSKFEKDNVKLTEKYRLLLNELIDTNKMFAEVEKELSENTTALAGVTEDKEALLDCLGNLTCTQSLCILNLLRSRFSIQNPVLNLPFYSTK